MRNSFIDLLEEAHPGWAYEECVLETSVLAAEAMCSNAARTDKNSVQIPLHEQRRRGMAAALGLPETALGKSVSVQQLIAADAPYTLLTVGKPRDAGESEVEAGLAATFIG